jgi:hypothetical protein
MLTEETFLKCIALDARRLRRIESHLIHGSRSRAGSIGRQVGVAKVNLGRDAVRSC